MRVRVQRAQLNRVRSAVLQVRGLHVADFTASGVCQECMKVWPCPTRVLLDAVSVPEELL